MDTHDFENLVVEVGTRDPVLLQLRGEGPMSRDAVDAAEAGFDVVLPALFAWFLERFGAGHFALAVVYSLVSDGLDSVAWAVELPWIAGLDFFPIADNGAGDYYGFVINTDRTLTTEVFLLDHELGAVREEFAYSNFLEFVAAIGLTPG